MSVFSSKLGVSRASTELCCVLSRGVTLILDIGVIDINTCEPLSDAFVELWAGTFCARIYQSAMLMDTHASANATGVYSSYTATLGGGGGSAPSNSSNATMSMMPSGSASGSASAVPSSMPSGSAGGSTGSMSSSALVRSVSQSSGSTALLRLRF